MAGINWVRDRLNWGEMETAAGEFASHTRYDTSALAQNAGRTANLAGQPRFSRLGKSGSQAVSRRPPPRLPFLPGDGPAMGGKVLAFEPWNEADIPMFGGHTGSEIASLQKASYLGLKAGNPRIIACQNVFADHGRAILAEFQANQAWPYFDTFNLHHYAAVNQYPAIYADFRGLGGQAAVGHRVQHAGELVGRRKTAGARRSRSPRSGRADGEGFCRRSTKAVQAAFYFMLPHYVEGQTQFGLIHPDLTPRPAYVALAAVGRLLADAKPLGKLKAGQAERSRLACSAPARRQGTTGARGLGRSQASRGCRCRRGRWRRLTIWDGRGRRQPTRWNFLRPRCICCFPPIRWKSSRGICRPRRPPGSAGAPSPVVFRRSGRSSGWFVPVGLPHFGQQARADSDLRLQLRLEAGRRAAVGRGAEGLETKPARADQSAARRAASNWRWRWTCAGRRRRPVSR